MFARPTPPEHQNLSGGAIVASVYQAGVPSTVLDACTNTSIHRQKIGFEPWSFG